MRRTIILIFAAGLSAAVMAQTMTLEQCVDYAIAHNIDIARQQVRIEQQKVEVNTSENQWLPRVDAEVTDMFNLHQTLNVGYVPTDLGTLPKNVVLNALQPVVTASMPLYTGGRLSHQVASDRLDLQSATYQLEKARKDVRIQVATHYLQVLYYQGLADVAMKQVDVSRELVERAKKLYEEGRRPKSDVADAESRLATDEYLLAQHQGNVTLSTVNLAQLLNMEDVAALRVEDPALTNTTPPDESAIQSPQQTYADIVENYPSILALKTSLRSLHHRVDIARSAYLPQVSLKASVGTNYYYIFHDDVKPLMENFSDQVWRNFNPIVGLSVSYNIFNGHQTRNSVSKARLAVQAGELDLHNARLSLRKELQQAYYNAMTSASKYRSAVSAEQASRTSYEYNKKKYDAGKGTIFDIDEATQRWVQAQEDVLQSRYDYLIRKKILDFYIEQ